MQKGPSRCFALEQIHIANKAVYLASDETERTTGQIFPVDRGATVR
jgi:enoyl-[acyl-carrier-protein] reductase (NADH)